MASNGEIIRNSLREINVISEIDTPSAEQGQHALSVMNDMLASWVEDGVELGYFEQDSTADECPIPDSSKLAVTTGLATMLAPTYGATITPELGVKAANAYATLLRNAVVDGMTEADMSYMPAGSGRCVGGLYDIDTGDE